MQYIFKKRILYLKYLILTYFCFVIQYDKGEYMDKGLISRIDYIDNNFVKLFYIEEKYYEVAKTSQINGKVQLGDMLIYEYDDAKNKIYKLYSKAEAKEYFLDDAYLILNEDENYYYIIKNNSEKIISIQKTQKKFAIYDIVNLEESKQGKFLVANNQMTHIFKKALDKFGKNVEIKQFSITRVFANEFHKKGVCLSPIENFENLIYEGNTKFEKNLNYGDIYFDIKIGKNHEYVLDEINTPQLSGAYIALYNEKFNISKNATAEEVLKRTKNILDFYNNKKIQLEKVSENVKEENLPYKENNVLGEFYLDELEEDNEGKYFRAINYNENADNKEIKVYLSNLPKIIAREGDSIVMVKDDFGQIKFYFTNKYIENSLTDKMGAEMRRLNYLNNGGLWK